MHKSSLFEFVYDPPIKLESLLSNFTFLHESPVQEGINRSCLFLVVKAEILCPAVPGELHGIYLPYIILVNIRTHLAG